METALDLKSTFYQCKKTRVTAVYVKMFPNLRLIVYKISSHKLSMSTLTSFP